MNWSSQSEQTSFYLQMMEKRVSKDDMLRIIDKKIDFSFINELCAPYYSDLGPTGYCPERLFRMLVVMYMSNIRSERRLVEELNVNIRYMWFCKIDLDNPVPDHSTFSVLRKRLGDDLFKQVFESILAQMLEFNVTQPKSISVDSTSVLADVKPPVKEDEGAKAQDKQTISPHDPDARYGHTSPKKSFFGYKAQMMVDNNTGTILNVDAQPGNFDDQTLDQGFLKEPLKRHKLKPKYAALDKGFDTYKIRKIFKQENIKTAIPLKKSKHAHVYPIDHFQIDLKNKEILCPAQQPMKYLGFDQKRSTYEFIGTACQNCRLKTQCTTGSFRRLTVHQDYLLRQKAKVFNQTRLFRNLYDQRNCIERVNAEAKRFHGLIRARFRRLWKFKIQCYLTAIVINLKRVAKFFLQTPNIRLTGP